MNRPLTASLNRCNYPDCVRTPKWSLWREGKLTGAYCGPHKPKLTHRHAARLVAIPKRRPMITTTGKPTHGEETRENPAARCEAVPARQDQQ